MEEAQRSPDNLTNNSRPVGSTREQEIDEADWQAFQQTDYLRNHWSDPEWPAKRRCLDWYVVLDDQGLRDHVAALQRQLDHLEYLDLVPTDALHLTVQTVDFVDRLTAGDITAIEERSREACRDIGAMHVEVGPVAGYAGGALLRVTPWAPVQRLKSRLHEAARQVLGPDWSPPYEPVPFKPHVTISYCHAPAGTVPAGEFIERLGTLRGDTRLPLTIRTVDLLDVRREHRVYRWDHRATLQL